MDFFLRLISQYVCYCHTEWLLIFGFFFFFAESGDQFSRSFSTKIFI